MRTCVVQYAGGHYSQLLAATFAVHQDRCRRLRYDYLASTIPWTDRHPFWEKCALILSAANKGYEHIIWLDSDTLWLGEPLILPPTIFGLTWHDLSEPYHYNAGVIYVNNIRGQAVSPLTEWWSNPDHAKPIDDQIALNSLLRVNPEWATRLDHRWNSVEHIPAYRAENPAVKAWHGMDGNCLEQMKEAICNSIQTCE